MQTLGIFARHPDPGHVKTRLAEHWGTDRATRLYAAFLADLIRKFSTTADRRVIGFTGTSDDPASDAAEAYFASLSQDNYQLWRQPPGPLGIRMASFFEEHLLQHGDRTVLVGSDSPTLPPGFVQSAFDKLSANDVVLGPAFDGGYYLIGMRYPPRPLFDGIEWSRAGVLAQTVSAINAHQVTLGSLPPWYDVDTWDDLLFLRGHLAALQSAGEVIDCPRTAGMLRLDTLDVPDGL